MTKTKSKFYVRADDDDDYPATLRAFIKDEDGDHLNYPAGYRGITEIPLPLKKAKS